MIDYPIVWTAAGIAFVHTLLGPDHYLPFVALGKARGWSTPKTLGTTAICGLGHVGSSLLLGLGIAAGSWSVASVTDWEGLRGDTAAWLLLGIGVAYALWGLKQYSRCAKPDHSHSHAHADGTVHDHGHDHHAQHVHPHASRRNLISWSLFVVFVLGPCEPLVPLIMVPASQRNLGTTVAVAVVFVLVTMVTMLSVVYSMVRGLNTISRRAHWRADHLGHVAAGSTLACCGLTMLLGL